MYPVKVSRKRTLTLPPAFDKFLSKGDRFMAFASDDTIMLKQVKEPVWETASRFPDPDEMNLAEIDKIVHEVRHEMNRGKKK
jgi:hypothetical protein